MVRNSSARSSFLFLALTTFGLCAVVFPGCKGKDSAPGTEVTKEATVTKNRLSATNLPAGTFAVMVTDYTKKASAAVHSAKWGNEKEVFSAWFPEDSATEITPPPEGANDKKSKDAAFRKAVLGLMEETPFIIGRGTKFPALESRVGFVQVTKVAEKQTVNSGVVVYGVSGAKELLTRIKTQLAAKEFVENNVSIREVTTPLPAEAVGFVAVVTPPTNSEGASQDDKKQETKQVASPREFILVAKGDTLALGSTELAAYLPFTFVEKSTAEQADAAKAAPILTDQGSKTFLANSADDQKIASFGAVSIQSLMSGPDVQMQPGMKELSYATFTRSFDTQLQDDLSVNFSKPQELLASDKMAPLYAEFPAKSVLGVSIGAEITAKLGPLLGLAALSGQAPVSNDAFKLAGLIRTLTITLHPGQGGQFPSLVLSSQVDDPAAALALLEQSASAAMKNSPTGALKFEDSVVGTTKTRMLKTPFGIGLFIAPTKNAVVASTSSDGMELALNTDARDAAPTGDRPAHLVYKVRFAELAEVLKAFQGGLALLTGGSSANANHDKTLVQLGRLGGVLGYLTSNPNSLTFTQSYSPPAAEAAPAS